MKVRFLLVCTALSLLPCAGKAMGAPVTAPLSTALKGDAKSAYEEAKALYKDGDLTGASAKFKHAYDISGDARLLWNMAACEKELRHYGSAYNLVARYLTEGAGKLTDDSVATAKETQAVLRRFYSILRVTADPRDSRVVVDGTVAVVPPDGSIALDLGTRDVRVEREGYEPFETHLDVPGNTEIPLTVTLKPQPTTGQLSVHAGPKDAIAVDGEAKGVGTWQGNLAPGEHVVDVTAAGKKPYETRVEIASQSTHSLDIALEDGASPARSLLPTWAWIAGGAVLAGGIVGGYFLLRPSDQPGSTPRGQLGTVEFSLHGTQF